MLLDDLRNCGASDGAAITKIIAKHVSRETGTDINVEALKKEITDFVALAASVASEADGFTPSSLASISTSVLVVLAIWRDSAESTTPAGGRTEGTAD